MFEGLRAGRMDFAFSDQRRAFSNEYVNRILYTGNCFVEISARSPLAALALSLIHI